VGVELVINEFSHKKKTNSLSTNLSANLSTKFIYRFVYHYSVKFSKFNVHYRIYYLFVHDLRLYKFIKQNYYRKHQTINLPLFKKRDIESRHEPLTFKNNISINMTLFGFSIWSPLVVLFKLH